MILTLTLHLFHSIWLNRLRLNVCKTQAIIFGTPVYVNRLVGSGVNNICSQCNCLLYNSSPHSVSLSSTTPAQRKRQTSERSPPSPSTRQLQIILCPENLHSISNLSSAIPTWLKQLNDGDFRLFIQSVEAKFVVLLERENKLKTDITENIHTHLSDTRAAVDNVANVALLTDHC